FEQSEMVKPRMALDQAGAQTTLVSLKSGEVRAWSGANWGDSFPVDLPIAEAQAIRFDALLLPGGVLNPDKLRMNPQAVAFVKAIGDAGKPIAAICHGPWTLINAGLAKGKKLTSWPSLKADLSNAGAHWVDEACVVDDKLVTSRKPDDIPAFNEAMIREFAKVADRVPGATLIMTDPAM
ncbi:MAG: type 1 glutamine amidotransferase domain-containing protein, partial [Asticcacaulis sp.]